MSKYVYLVYRNTPNGPIFEDTYLSSKSAHRAVQRAIDYLVRDQIFHSKITPEEAPSYRTKIGLTFRVKEVPLRK